MVVIFPTILECQFLTGVESLYSSIFGEGNSIKGRLSLNQIIFSSNLILHSADELQTTYASNEKLPTSERNSNENFPLENTFTFDQPEDTCTDTEDNDSPTVHCTFTLPSWRINKYTTPSSTESESYPAKNKYVDTRQTKTDRQRGKYFKDDNSSGGDENYDGSDETTLYIDLRSMKNKNKRRESSDNISTSASESLVHSDPRELAFIRYSPSPEHTSGVDDQNVLYCSLTLDGEKGNEVKERKLNARNADAEVEHLLGCDLDAVNSLNVF